MVSAIGAGLLLRTVWQLDRVELDVHPVAEELLGKDALAQALLELGFKGLVELCKTCKLLGLARFQANPGAGQRVFAVIDQRNIERLRCINQLIQSCNILLFHHARHQTGTDSTEIQPTKRQVVPASH